jgi:Complex 1 protein (LYR family)
MSLGRRFCGNQHPVKVLQLAFLEMMHKKSYSSLFGRQQMISFSSSSSSIPAADDDDGHKSSTSKAQTKPSRRRRRRKQEDDNNMDDDESSSFIDMKSVPSYKEFVHRHTVLSLYRRFLRSVRIVRLEQRNTTMADELLNEIRREFRSQKNETDPFQRQRALADGQRRADELRGLTGEPAVPTSTKLQQQDADSWMNIQDPDDLRGRVGDVWPWMK